MLYFINEWFTNIPWNAIGVFCSIVGFVITVVTFIKVLSTKKALGNLKQEVLFNARCEDVLQNLVNENSSFVIGINTQDENEIKVHLNALISSLKNLKKITKHKDIEEILKTLNNYFDSRTRTKEISMDTLEKIYWQIDRLIKEIQDNRLNSKILGIYESR